MATVTRTYSRKNNIKKSRYRKRKMQTGKVYIMAIAGFMAIVLGVKIVTMYNRNKEYEAKEEELQAALDAALEKKEQLKEYESYTQTHEYAESTAKSKLGLIYENEIIFREK